jgi:hypothetical protein
MARKFLSTATSSFTLLIFLLSQLFYSYITVWVVLTYAILNFPDITANYNLHDAREANMINNCIMSNLLLSDVTYFYKTVRLPLVEIHTVGKLTLTFLPS